MVGNTCWQEVVWWPKYAGTACLYHSKPRTSKRLEVEAGLGSNPKCPPFGDTLYLGGSTEGSQTPQTALPAEDQVFKVMSLQSTFHI